MFSLSFQTGICLGVILDLSSVLSYDKYARLKYTNAMGNIGLRYSLFNEWMTSYLGKGNVLSFFVLYRDQCLNNNTNFKVTYTFQRQILFLRLCCSTQLTCISVAFMEAIYTSSIEKNYSQVIINLSHLNVMRLW